MKVRMAISGVLSLLVAGVGASWASVPLPFADSFETWPSSWSITGGGTATNTGTAITGSTGTKALVIDNATATLAVTPSSYENVWIQIYAKPVQGAPDSEPTPGANVNGAFYITTSGQLKAFSGGSWVNVPLAGSTRFSNPSIWYGFIVHADYLSHTWDIYTTTGAYKTNMVLLNTDGPLTFSNGSVDGALSSVVVESGNAASVDAVAVSRTFNTYKPGSTGDKVAVYEHPATNGIGIKRDFELPIYAALYAGTPNNQVGDIIGNDIASGLLTNDTLFVYKGNPTGFDEFVIPSLASGRLGARPNSELTTPVKSFTALKLKVLFGRDQTFSFFPYTNANVVVENGAYVTGGSHPSETMTLNGKGSEGSGAGQEERGFTALNAAATVRLADLPFNNPPDDPSALGVGDFMYVSSPSSPNAWSVYKWNGTSWVKLSGSGIDPLPSGGNMWVKRSALSPSLPITLTH